MAIRESVGVAFKRQQFDPVYLYQVKPPSSNDFATCPLQLKIINSAMLYHLSTAEKKTLAGKMETFCQEQTGLSLKDYCAQIQAEDMEPSAGPVMQQGG